MWRLKYKSFSGLFHIILTSFFLTLTSVFVKKLAYINQGQLVMIRCMGIWMGCVPIAIYNVKEILGPKKDRILLLIRGFSAAVSFYLHFTAFRYVPLADAVIISSTVPMVTTVIAHFWLKEPYGLVQLISLLFTLCAMLLSVRIPELLNERTNTELETTYFIGLASAIISVFTLSIGLVISRKLKNIHFSIIPLYIGFIGMLQNGFITAVSSVFIMPYCGWDMVLALLIGIFSFVAHCTFTRAIQIQAVGIVTVTKASMDIVIAIIFQIIFFGMEPDIYTASAASLVILSLSINGFKNWLKTLPIESKMRKKFKSFLL